MKEMDRARKERTIGEQTAKLSHPSITFSPSLPFSLQYTMSWGRSELDRDRVWSQQTFHWILLEEYLQV